MRISEIYKNKETGGLIQIDSFATRMNTHKDIIIIFNRLMNDEFGNTAYSPSSNGYGTQEDIEKEYVKLEE